MKTGQTVSDDQPLQQMGVGHADTMAKLREMELEAFMATNRVDDLRKEAGVVAETADSETKSKIISRLGGDAEPQAQESRAEAEAEATAQATKANEK